MEITDDMIEAIAGTDELTGDAILRFARAILALAQDAALVPDGWQWVPIEPTPEMIAAMAVVEATGRHNRTPCIGMAGSAEAYSAMLSAAPSQPGNAPIPDCRKQGMGGCAHDPCAYPACKQPGNASQEKQ